MSVQRTAKKKQPRCFDFFHYETPGKWFGLIWNIFFCERWCRKRLVSILLTLNYRWSAEARKKQAGFRRCATNSSTTNSIRFKMALQISECRKVDPSVEDNEIFPRKRAQSKIEKRGPAFDNKEDSPFPVYSRCQNLKISMQKQSGTNIFS